MIVLIIILAVVLRLINIDQSLWLDEASQVILSNKPLVEIIFDRQADFHPPLSYLLTHFWVLLGNQEIWLRLLPIIFGVGTVFILYSLCLKLFNRQAAVLASLLLAISPYHIYYSQEVRMYSALGFFAILSMYFLVLTLNKTASIWNRTGYILVTICLIHTHYLGFLLIIPQLFYVLIYHKEEVKRFLINISLITLIWLPWLPIFWSQLQSGQNAENYLPGWSLGLSLYKSIPLTLVKFTIGRIDIENNILYAIVAAIILSLVSYLLVQAIRKNHDKNIWLILFWFSFPIIIAFIISLKLPIYQPFRLIFVLPAFYILLALGLLNSNYKKPLIAIFILISLAGVSVYNLNPRFQREDWKGATAFVSSKLTDNSAVIFAWPEPFDPFKFYISKYSTRPIAAHAVIKNFPGDQQEIYKNLNSINKNEYFVFEYLQPLSDPENFINQWFKDNDFTEKDIYNFNGVGFIRHYVKNK